MSPLVELGARDGGSDSELVSALRARLSHAGDEVNVRNLGLRPLLLAGNPAKPTSLTFVHDLRNMESIHFANFGEDGFLLARLSEHTPDAHQWPIEWATLQLNRNELPRARSGLFSAMKTSRAEIPEPFVSIPVTALDAFLGATSAPQACRLASILRHSSFELFEHEKATCVLRRSPRDERFPEQAHGSKVLCLHKEKKILLDTRLDLVHFALPSADGEEVLFYEGAFRPPRISRLKLATLELSEVVRPVVSLGEVPPQNSHVVPDIPLAIYLCSTPASSGQPANSLVWLLEDADIAKGMRLPILDSDRAWIVTDGKDGGLLVDGRRWTDAVPPSESLPHGRCVLEPHVDALCGLTILRRAVTLTGEILKGSFATPEVRAPLLYAAFQSLLRVERGLSGWLLEQETALLLELFGNELLNRPELQTFLPKEAEAQLRQRLEADVPTFRSHEESERQRLRAQVGAPDGLWTALLNSEKKQAEQPEQK